MNIVGKNLKKFREASGLSQKELAQHMSVTRQTISNWERGISQPDLDSLMLLADTFQVEAVDIIYEKLPHNEFQSTKPKRIKLCIIIGILFCLMLLITQPLIFLSKSNILVCVIIRVTFYPANYLIGSVFLMSLLYIWIDIGIKNINIRFCLITISIFCILLYFIFMYTAVLDILFGFNLNDILNSYSLYYWLKSYPVIFIFPGAMLFLGFNRKPKVSDESP